MTYTPSKEAIEAAARTICGVSATDWQEDTGPASITLIIKEIS